MKKYVLIFLLMVVFPLVTFPAFAVDTWQATNQGSIEWDPVTLLENGDPLPVGEVVKYKVLIKPEVGGAEIDIGIISDLFVTITFTQEGRWIVGVAALRYNASDVLVGQSPVSWSDNPLVVSGFGTFGFTFYRAPKGPVNLRVR